MIETDPSHDLNFWPAFADLMLSLVLVLCLLLFLVVAVISFGSVNLQEVETNQQSMVDAIAKRYGTAAYKDPADGSVGISTANDGAYDIRIQNDLNSQRITFTDKLLFRPDETLINPTGAGVLDVVGDTLKTQLPLVKEIQIQGHADTQKSGRFASNTKLASERAIAVFEYLQNKVGIDPAKNLMSATTFGEFKSVQRTDTNPEYDLDKLLEDNSAEDLRSRNRRIELVLIYRRQIPK